MTTLSDIAKRAGVHISTASKALNDSPDLNVETREMIKGIAKELNYINVRKVSKSNTKPNMTIGVICPEIRSNYYAQLISMVEKNLKRHGYSLIIGFSNFQYEDEVQYLSNFSNNMVRGIILITENKKIDDFLMTFKKKYNGPLVLVATESEIQNYDYIKIDDALGVQLIVEHLIETGHRKIAYIGDSLSQNRLNAFQDTLKKHSMTMKNNHWIKIGSKRFEECGYDLMNEILKGSSLPTAVFAAYDDIAIGAMRAVKEHGLNIPEDISFAGIDNVDVTPYLSKKLTTISYPIDELGDIASEILLKKINDTNYTVIKHITLKPELIIRETTMT